MPRSKAVTSKLAVQERLPDLNVSDTRTKSSALHQIHYIGPLFQWPYFCTDVETEFLNHPWGNNRHHLYRRPLGEASPHSLLKEHCLVGNEIGVQGRWNTHVGEVMSAIFHEQQFDLTFADFVCAGEDYSKNPDLALISATPNTLVVGELKTPWIKHHNLSKAARVDAKHRHVLGQIVEYMYDLEVKYGIMSTYDQTVFLRLYHDPTNGGWQVQYSPVIYHDTSYSQGNVTVRQCIWFLAQRAHADHTARNLPPKEQWITKKSSL
ncbi:hypothetical protein AbraIFM66951_000546 [Aspergillus brasiliensis]|uniref:Uncharacterized protein n=1 Tax=Aspergillus brasiliensis TaxID=319629 RepID=A0A9W6DRM5_9EURO|nr:hypothetical protein AbraCBS73388_000660 [Aspergillus brasiliensis]GKZ48480.1 hypothetical protein AbraIFM66951_000546 [Aspergillus brasiliensis]